MMRMVRIYITEQSRLALDLATTTATTTSTATPRFAARTGVAVITTLLLSIGWVVQVEFVPYQEHEMSTCTDYRLNLLLRDFLHHQKRIFGILQFQDLKNLYLRIGCFHLKFVEQP